jgi:hypothetical protein
MCLPKHEAFKGQSLKVMNSQQSLIGGSIGCGLLGCAGGLLLGLFGGSLLLILVSFGWAVTSTVTPALPPPSPNPDLRLVLHEDFLNRVGQDSLGDTARLDILPGNRLSVAVDTDLSAFGLSGPVQITGLFELQLIGQSLEVRLIDLQVSGLDLPPEMTNFFDANLAAINQDLNLVLEEVSAILGRPIVLTGLGTDQTSLWIEAREAP